MDEPDKDFMVVSLDLLSGIVQALNTDADPLVAKSSPPLFVCLQDKVAEVRQAAYALLGDLAISCFHHIQPSVPQLMPLLLSEIDPNPTAECVSVCNNATWAAGEIAIKWGPEINPYIESLLHRLFLLIVNPELQRTLMENVAITIGRLGSVAPHAVAPHLENFVDPWLKALVPIRDNEEKASAYFGLCAMILVNPEGCLNVKPFAIPACS